MARRGILARLAPGKAAAPDAAVSKSFEWYVDGAKWLLAIIAGVLTLGMGALKDARSDWSFWTFGASALVLLAGGAFGVSYLWNAYDYASLREGGAAKDAHAAVERQALNDWLFAGLVWCFRIGMLLFIGFGALAIWSARPPDPDKLVVTPASGPDAVAIAQRGRHIWLLKPAAGGYQWLEIAPPPKPKDEAKP
jgi:hypothetical protein